MDLFRKFASTLSSFLAAVLLYTATPISPAFAGIVTSEQMIDLQAAEIDRAHVADFVRREDVRRQMIDLGVDHEEVDRRIATLSDGEIRALAERIDQMPAGQGTAALLILVAVVLVTVFVMTDMMGMTDIFPFIDAQSDRGP